MLNQQNYAATPIPAGVRISTANTARDGTGTLGTVFQATSAGARVDSVSIAATGTTTAGMVRLFLFNGTSNLFLTEVPVTAATPSGTVQAFRTALSGLALVIPPNGSLKASTHNAESFDVVPMLAGGF